MKTSLFSGLTLLALLATSSDSVQAQGYRVIVHPSNTVSTLDRSLVSNLFLKRTTQWDDGRRVFPVDLPVGSGVRSAFSESVHRKSVSALKAYWQKMVFSGRGVPPPEKASVSEIVAYVESNPGAVGYVPAGSAIGSCRAVAVE